MLKERVEIHRMVSVIAFKNYEAFASSPVPVSRLLCSLRSNTCGWFTVVHIVQSFSFFYYICKRPFNPWVASQGHRWLQQFVLRKFKLFCIFYLLRQTLVIESKIPKLRINWVINFIRSRNVAKFCMAIRGLNKYHLWELIRCFYWINLPFVYWFCIGVFLIRNCLFYLASAQSIWIFNFRIGI